MTTECIYKFEVSYGQHGTLLGTFTAMPEDVAFAISKTVYFEEPWGKHSGAECTFAPAHFTVVSYDAGEVATFKRLNLRNGECPLGLLRDCILDGRLELTDEERAAMPAYYR